MTPTEISNEIERLQDRNRDLESQAAAQYRTYLDWKASYDAAINDCNNRPLKSSKWRTDCRAGVDGYQGVKWRAALASYNAINAEIDDNEHQIDLLTAQLPDAQQSANTVSEALADQGLSAEALVTRELEKGKTDRFGLETTTDARSQAITETATAQRLAAETDAEQTKQTGKIITGIVVVIVIVAAVLVIRKIRKKKAKK